MKTLIITILLFFTASAQMPTGTATPMFTPSTHRENVSIKQANVNTSDPTQNIVCDFFVANWGKANWKGTRENPFSYRTYHRKRFPRGKWVCDISDNLGEVNGN